MNTKTRIVAMLMVIAMVFCLTGCGEKEKDFLKNGWDGGVDPTTAEAQTDATGEETTGEEVTDESGEVVTDESGEAVTVAPTEGGKNDNSQGGNSQGGSSQGGNSQNTNKNPGTNTGTTKPNGGSTTTTKPSGGSSPTTTKPSGGSSPTTGTTAPANKTYTAAEALELYKSAANPIKTKDGITVTRTREVYTEYGSSNLSGLSGTIIKSAFGPKDDTKAKVLSSKSDIIKGFVVEKQSYVCALTTADIKSATAKQSGDNIIVTIYVKDDTGTNQNYSNKAVSSTAVAELAGTFASGLTMKCKDVRVTATIDAQGRLINLNTYMPARFEKGSESFGAAIEQWWTIKY